MSAFKAYSNVSTNQQSSDRACGWIRGLDFPKILDQKLSYARTAICPSHCVLVESCSVSIKQTFLEVATTSTASSEFQNPQPKCNVRSQLLTLTSTLVSQLSSLWSDSRFGTKSRIA